MVTIELWVIDHKTGSTLSILENNLVSDIIFSDKINDIGTLSFAFKKQSIYDVLKRNVVPYMDSDFLFDSGLTFDDAIYSQTRVDLYLSTLFSTDNFVDVYIYNNNVKTLFATYLIRSTKTTYVFNDEVIVVGCVGLNDLLKRRILDVENDTYAIAGYVTHSDYIHNVLSFVANEHLIDCVDERRNIPNLSINILNVSYQTVGFRERYKNILELFQELCSGYVTCFRIVKPSQNLLELQLGDIGSDRTYKTNRPYNDPYYILSQELGNLGSSPSIDNNRTEEKTWVYLLGEGDELNQSVLQWNDPTGVGASNLNRIEFSADYTQSGDNFSGTFEDKLTQAVKHLNDNKAKYTLAFDVNPNTIMYPVVLGDIVTLHIGQDNIDVRLIEISYSMNQLDLTITYKFEEVIV